MTNNDLSDISQEIIFKLENSNIIYGDIKRRVDAASLNVGNVYTFEQDCYVYFGASFTSTSGYCRVFITNEKDEIVHYMQINPAPVSGNAVITGEYFAKKAGR